MLIYSQHAFAKEIKTLEKSIVKEREELEKQLRAFSKQPFKCRHDADIALKPLRKKLKYHKLNISITDITGYSKRGRPSLNDAPEVIGCGINYKLEEDSCLIEAVKLRKGRFILATNELDATKIADCDILHEYKQQSGVEKGFTIFSRSTRVNGKYW